MYVLVGSHNSHEWGRWCDRYGGGGCLYSPPKRPHPGFSYYALDNYKYVCWSKGIFWDEAAFKKHVAWAVSSPHQPQWILVPDEVCDRERTLELWQKWYAELALYGVPLAFAVQDGMSAIDVPPEANVVFVGGSTEWKWRTVEYWCDRFKRVHVARVNSWQKLWRCKEIGAKSVDGTGWFRGKEERHDLHLFLAVQAGLLPGVEGEAAGFPYISPRARRQLLDRYLKGWHHWDISIEPLWMAQ